MPNLLHVALYEPEIPPNTGNIIRLCANTGTTLHLIHPLGFKWDDKQLKRAGLDYQEFATINHYRDYDTFCEATQHQRCFALTTKTSKIYTDVTYAADDILLFGPESRGLPSQVRSADNKTAITIPMMPNSRSLNLSNSVAIVLYEAWRQLNFQI